MRGEWTETGKGESEVSCTRLDFAGGVVSLPEAVRRRAESSPDVTR